MALLKKKNTLWRGLSYIINNSHKWEVLSEDEANKLLEHHIRLRVNPVNINYFGENNFEYGTWVHIENEEDINIFKQILFPYVPTACLKQGWNYVIEADNICRTETKEEVLAYLNDLVHKIP